MVKNYMKNRIIFSLIRDIWKQLYKRRKIQLSLLIFLMLLSGIAEMISVFSIIPFLEIISNSDNFLKYEIFSFVLSNFSAKEVNLIFTLGFIFAIALATSTRILTLWINMRLSAAIGADFGYAAYRNILFKDFDFHLNLNSSSMIAIVMTKIDELIKLIVNLLSAISSSLIVFTIFIGLIIVDIKFTIGLGFCFAIGYLLIASLTKRKLSKNSKIISKASDEKAKAVQEGLGSIREILLEGDQKRFINSYREADLKRHIGRAKNTFMRSFPRFVLEGLGIILFAIGSFIFLVINPESASILITLMGTLALAASKLLPATQSIYSGWSTIYGNSESALDVLRIIKLKEKSFPGVVKPNIKFKNISFKNVSYKYPNSNQFILKNLNFEINVGEKLGIIGSTGSGKSTLLDLLMGLLEPTDGEILIDGININNKKNKIKLLQWRKSISHVPQDIFLSDSSIKDNIIFGRKKDHYESKDESDFINCLEVSQLRNFIQNLEDGDKTFVGERGIRLSGGQKQRIGIARAIYKSKNVFVLDEATSALDENTEKNFMRSLNKYYANATLIMISHRLSSIKNLDRIIKLNDGIITIDKNPKEIKLDNNLYLDS